MAEERKQTAVSQRAKPDQRIIYVEPNDVFDEGADGRSMGYTLTPKYEDFCISFNLIIEAFSRLKSEIKTSSKNRKDSKIYNISWGLTKEDMKKRRSSLLQGNRGADTLTTDDGSFAYSESPYNFLTTYYTDISFDTYNKKTEIEGLGVESVQISYESWYTPTVVIKFVDVRGAALFGREEALHIDGELQSENIFGAFFTMPFPLFRLQVKGFIGKPVTYQLTCSNFKGQFNSNTGNFEATVTFIGYSWSLMTDIPFAYLAAAPYATYIGSDYWEAHKHSEAWALWNDEGNRALPPPKLMRFFENIQAALDKEDRGAATEEQKKELTSMDEEGTLMNAIKSGIKTFVDALNKSIGGGMYKQTDNTNHHLQYIFFGKSADVTYNDDTKKAYKELYEAFTKYQIGGNNRKDITTKKLPNGWEAKEEPPSIKLLEILDIKHSGNTVSSISLTNGKTVNADNLMEINFNEKGGKIHKTLAEDLEKQIKAKDDKLTNYCYLIDFNDVIHLIEEREKEVESRQTTITNEINESIQLKIIEVLGGVEKGGFKPFIGNVFKIIFCHLETFCHIMLDSAEEIYQQYKTGARKPNELGLNKLNFKSEKESFGTMDITSSDKIENIVPWPAIYNEGRRSSDCGYVSEIHNVYGWVGDVSDKFIEQKVVYALQDGIKMLFDETSSPSNQESNKIYGFPWLSTDFLNSGSVFDKAQKGNLAELAGCLAIRMALGFIVKLSSICNSSDFATLCGRMDAYNLFYSMPSTMSFSNLVKDVDVDVLLGIMLCKDEDKYNKFSYAKSEDEPNKRFFAFETAKRIKRNNKERHPFFVEAKSDSGKDILRWCYFEGEGVEVYIPSTLKPFNQYHNTTSKLGDGTSDFIYNYYDVNNCHFQPNYTKDVTKNLVLGRDWVYWHNSSQIKELSGLEKNYINRHQFGIITNKGKAKSIKEKFEEYAKGSFKVGEYTTKDDLKKWLSKDSMYAVGENRSYTFYNTISSRVLTYNVNAFIEAHKEDNTYLNAVLTSGDVNNSKFNSTFDITNGNFKEKNISVDDNGNISFDGKQIDINNVQVVPCYITEDNNDYQLFISPFYYYQNNINDLTLRLKVKAFLFLMTFYNWGDLGYVLYGVPKGKSSWDIFECNILSILSVSAIIWRKRYADEHNGIDPIYYGSKYRSIGIDNIPFEHIKNNDYMFKVFSNNARMGKLQNAEYIYKIDYNIQNQLLELFEEFVKTDFQKIQNSYELFKLGNDISELINNIKTRVKEINSDTGLDEATKSNQYIELVNGIAEGELVSKYRGIYVNADGTRIVLYFPYEENVGVKLLRDLFFETCYIMNATDNPQTTDSGKVGAWYGIDIEVARSYLKGFCDACKDVISAETTNVGDETNNMNVSKEAKEKRDISVAIYYYLKNVWDKWLVVAAKDEFDVKNFFDENFVFIDSFYINTYHTLAINCEQFLDIWYGLADNGSLFNFLSQLCSKHGCLFLPVPDYVGFNGQTQEQDVETMESLFRPIAYNNMPDLQTNNKFVVMYSHPSSFVKSEDNAYPIDSYDIWSHSENKITPVARELFKSNKGVDVDRTGTLVTREGYNVPSFGVDFAKQNNHIFKSFNVTMENPVMTEQAIKAMWQIALKGSQTPQTIAFIGQDTFDVYTNYSYTITITMIGNAQICPLMYFQLMHIPMWRGTYMIFKVVHNMTPGDMTTTITAMKMNKYAKPFNSQFLITVPLDKRKWELCGTNSSTPTASDSSISVTGTEGSGGGTNPTESTETVGDAGGHKLFSNDIWSEVDLTSAPLAVRNKAFAQIDKRLGVVGVRDGNDTKARGLIVDVKVPTTNGMKPIHNGIHKDLANDLIKIFTEIKNIGFNVNYVTGWRLSSSQAPGNRTRHARGAAVDINGGSGGNPYFVSGPSKSDGEPSEGSRPKWSVRAGHRAYSGTYDSKKCIWHWGHPVVKIFAKYGWGWGGGYGDTMHFSVYGGR